MKKSIVRIFISLFALCFLISCEEMEGSGEIDLTSLDETEQEALDQSTKNTEEEDKAVDGETSV